MNKIERGIGWINRVKKDIEHFGADQLTDSNIPRTVVLLTVTAVIAGIAGAVAPEGNVFKLPAIILAVDNAGLATYLTMEGWGRIGDYNDVRHRESNPENSLEIASLRSQ